MEEFTSKNFIERIIENDLETKKNGTKVITRFPPEPNGYLHIGHAKSINLNYGLSQQYNGTFHLRFDDTNPAKEDMEYINSIIEDVKWLGADWKDNMFFASSYFDKMYELAIDLIKQGKAYVDDSNVEEIRKNRGTLTEPGVESPYRNRSVEENLKIFEDMKNGVYPDGAKVLRAKIDMSSPNLNFRDPIMYRILNADHPKTGNKWKIYPMYDWAHGLEDSIENITHSICTLEFEDHRPLYDWFLNQFPQLHHPQQIEFARLNINWTVMSKRKLLQLVTEKHVTGWDDPRMPTISGLRRRGWTSDSIKEFCKKIGLSKVDSTVDYAFLEHCLREDLNKNALRRMCVIDPVKVIITNFADDEVVWLDAENNPENPDAGFRKIPFTKELYIEADDFKTEKPNNKYYRLAPNCEIRLKHAFYVKCNDYELDENGKVKTIYCTYDPQSKGGWTNDGRMVKGTSHWVSAKYAKQATVNLYEKLFNAENPGERTGNFLDDINPNSVKSLNNCYIEPSLADAKPGENFQFLRIGYFTADLKNHSSETPTFNRSVTLKESFTKDMKNQSK